MAGRIIGYTALGLLVLILLLLVVPVGLHITYSDKLTIRLRVFGIPFSLPKSKSKAKSGQAAGKPSAGKLKPSRLSEAVKRITDDIKQNGVEAIKRYIDSVKALCDERVFTSLIGAFTANPFELSLFITAADASQTALGVGEVCAVLYPAIAALQRFLKIKRRRVTVMPDFLAESVRVELNTVLYTVPLCFLWALGRAVWIYRKYPFLPKTREEINNG